MRDLSLVNCEIIWMIKPVEVSDGLQGWVIIQRSEGEHDAD